jgi:hypothetical protein
MIGLTWFPEITTVRRQSKTRFQQWHGPIFSRLCKNQVVHMRPAMPSEVVTKLVKQNPGAAVTALIFVV